MDAGLQRSVEDPHMADHPFVSVEIGIENQSLQRGSAGRFGRRDAGDDGFKNVIDADYFLGAGKHGCIGGDGEDVLELDFGLRHVRVREIDLVDYGDDA